MKKLEYDSTPTPLKTSLMMYATRLGVILSNFSIIIMLIYFSSLITILINLVVILLALTVILVSFGFIFLVVPNFIDYLSFGSEFSGYMMEFLNKISPVAIPLTIFFSIAAFILLSFDKYKPHTGRKIISGMVCVGTIVILIVLIMQFKGGGV